MHMDRRRVRAVIFRCHVLSPSEGRYPRCKTPQDLSVAALVTNGGRGKGEISASKNTQIIYRQKKRGSGVRM